MLLFSLWWGLGRSLYDCSKGSKNKIKLLNRTDNRKHQLNTAVVNEDQAVKLNGKEYNLDASYVKISSEIIHKAGLYCHVELLNLVLQMENTNWWLLFQVTFQRKFLKWMQSTRKRLQSLIRSTLPEIHRLKMKQNKVAKDIVSDLRSQLVDMYMVSILSNLYTAQKNVETSNKIQSTNIGSYRSNLLDSALDSKNIFPSLYSLSTSSVESIMP